MIVSGKKAQTTSPVADGATVGSYSRHTPRAPPCLANRQHSGRGKGQQKCTHAHTHKHNPKVRERSLTCPSTLSWAGVPVASPAGALADAAGGPPKSSHSYATPDLYVPTKACPITASGASHTQRMRLLRGGTWQQPPQQNRAAARPPEATAPGALRKGAAGICQHTRGARPDSAPQTSTIAKPDVNVRTAFARPRRTGTRPLPTLLLAGFRPRQLQVQDLARLGYLDVPMRAKEPVCANGAIPPASTAWCRHPPVPPPVASPCGGTSSHSP